MLDYTLHNGDCAEILEQYKNKVDLIVTSPPYDALRIYGNHGFDFDAVADACVSSLIDGGVIVWVVADATVDGSETGTSFRHALGFLDRGLKLHDTMVYEKNSPSHPDKIRYQNVWEYMFVFSKGRPKTINLIRDRENKWAGHSSWGIRSSRQKDGTLKQTDKNNVVQTIWY